jgi:hypothetical protein
MTSSLSGILTRGQLVTSGRMLAYKPGGGGVACHPTIGSLEPVAWNDGTCRHEIVDQIDYGAFATVIWGVLGELLFASPTWQRVPPTRLGTTYSS